MLMPHSKTDMVFGHVRGWPPRIRGIVDRSKEDLAVMADINLKPLGDRLVVKPASREETTKSGIVLPDTAKEKPQRGTIIAAGEGRKDDNGNRVALDVKVGDNVLFAKYAGTEFKLDDDDLLILSEKDILAVIG
jgi:chaperonin GroES